MAKSKKYEVVYYTYSSAFKYKRVMYFEDEEALKSYFSKLSDMYILKSFKEVE